MKQERPPASDWQKSESSREYKNDNALREYQLEGVNWLLFNWYNTYVCNYPAIQLCPAHSYTDWSAFLIPFKCEDVWKPLYENSYSYRCNCTFCFVLRRNCILADEMGLGKTIQSITFLYEIYLKRIHGPFLVIAPLSTIPNWEREFRTWTELNVVVYHGSQASRKTIQAYDMYYRDTQVRNATFVMWYAFYNFGVIGANVSQVICRTYIRLYMTLYIGLCSQGPIIVTKSSFPAGSCNKGSLQIPCNHHHIWDDSDGLPRASECAVALCDHWWGS